MDLKRILATAALFAGLILGTILCADAPAPASVDVPPADVVAGYWDTN